MQLTMKTLGGRLTVPRCQEMAKSGKQCGQPAKHALDSCCRHKLAVMVTQVIKPQVIVSDEELAELAERQMRADRWHRMVQWAHKQFGAR